MNVIDWFHVISNSLSLLVVCLVWGRFIYKGIVNRNFQSVSRSVSVLGMFFVWLVIVIAQTWLARNGSSIEQYEPTYLVGYIVFPLTLIALARVVSLHVKEPIQTLFGFKHYRMLTFYSALIYGIFYIFASGMITFTSSEGISLSKEGFIKSSHSYGPLSIWPNVEIWWPALHLYGVISIAGVLMTFMLAMLIGMSTSFLVYQWKLQRKWNLKSMSSTVGSGLVVTTTCFVSCALPTVYPILLLLFGSATAEPLSRLIGNQSGFFVNFVHMAVLSLMVGNMVLITKRFQQLEKWS